MTSLLWFRRDLRLADHPALAAATQNGPVLGVFVVDEALRRPSGLPRRHFLAGCLEALDKSMNGRLLVVHGTPQTVLPRLAAAVEATAVHVSADYGPYGRRRDDAVSDALGRRDIAWVPTGSPYAVAPGRITKPDGGAYSVFAPFFHAWTAHGWRDPADSGSGVTWVDPREVDGGPARYANAKIGSALPSGMTLPEPGEQAALDRWREYREEHLADYRDDRNRPDHPGTSRLSPYLKWGCVHPRTLLADLAQLRNAGAAAYRRELAFREFYADLLFHQPDGPRKSTDPVIDSLPWSQGATLDQYFGAWRDGRTGYPYIDAGMRQLRAEGWIHNRVRMAVASFLIKDLHVPWQPGARHFMNLLVDGDVASNSFNWQWVAGSGPQSAPYYRIFNPVLQGHKFDPQGEYVRQYVPELAGVPGIAVHTPWELPDGIPPGYPERIVTHEKERAESLRAWEHRNAG